MFLLILNSVRFVVICSNDMYTFPGYSERLQNAEYDVLSKDEMCLAFTHASVVWLQCCNRVLSRVLTTSI